MPDKSGYIADRNKTLFAYHRGLINIADRKCKAIISFYFNSNDRDKTINDILVNKNEHIFILDSENNAFFSDSEENYPIFTDPNFLQNINTGEISGRFNWKTGADTYLVLYNISEADGWRIIKLIPHSEIYRAAQTDRNMSLVIGITLLIISILVVIFTSNAITRPFKKLSAKMDRFSKGDFDVSAEVSGYDEIAQLSGQFNMMVEKINDLINEKYKMKLIEKSAILKALEAEINPHFLYNSLQAISTKALKNGADDVSNMVDALASTFRYCISGQDIVTTAEEIRHVENYLVLQKARFGNRLTVLYELDDLALGAKIPILSIQTLVENSIKHALEEVSRAITIIIKVALKYNSILISVKDDGPGINPERLNELKISLKNDWEGKEGKSIGLRNLNTRLKLIYGKDSCLNIDTDENGTKISFLIPKGGVN